MANQLICLDTSVLIDYYRKTDKSNSFFFNLTQTYSHFAVSIITKYEVYIGSNEEQDKFWEKFFQNITVLYFDDIANKEAVKIFRTLKQKNKAIDIPDLLIGATASVHKLQLATLNNKHFSRIEGLKLITKN